jgi:hypothetical protein
VFLQIAHHLAANVAPNHKPVSDILTQYRNPQAHAQGPKKVDIERGLLCLVRNIQKLAI